MPVSSPPSAARPLVVAHRGAWGPAPQNSFEAFEQAVELGCDAVELDVRRTADGQIAVLHDARVRGRQVARLGHDQLQAMLKDGQAPALEDVLERLAGRIAVDIELKRNGYVEQVMAIVARRLTPDQYVVTSFRDAVLPEVRRFAPEARTGLLISPQRGALDLERRVVQADVDFVAPQAGLARAGLLAWAAARGLRSWVWTVNDARALTAVLGDARVEAVITDQPRRALAISGTSPLGA